MTHINQRRDYAAVWTSENPILPLGQLGWERDTGFAKLGDGVTAWNALDYAVQPGPVTSVNGDIGDVVLDKTDIGLSNVNNTSDMSKPVSTAQAAAIAAKASLASPAFTGNPTAPTASPGDNDTSIANTAFVTAAIAAALNAMWPVGSIFMNTSGTNPAAALGGTWAAWGSGRMPVGVDSLQTEFDAAEETGGAKTVTLTAANVPQHSHTMNHTHQSTSDGSDGGSTLAFRRSSNGAPTTGGGMVATFTGNTGTGNSPISASPTPVNNLPPYIACYFWKRTA